MKKYTFLFLLAAASVTANAQSVASNPVVTTSPSPVMDNQPVTIMFHSHRGDMGLAGYHQDSVYVHTGVIVAGMSGWQHVQTTWGYPGDSASNKATRVDDSTYTFTIPNMKSYYRLTGSEQIDSIAILFRSADGNSKGADTGSKDIFIKVTHVPTGVASVTNKGLSVSLSPNPVVNNLEAVFTNTSAAATSVSVTSMNGQVVIAKNFGTLQNGHVSIATDQLAPGIYIATFRAGDAVISQRITKQ